MMRTRTFECFCGDGNFTKEELVEHAKQEHPELKELLVCQVCDKAFKDYEEARDHLVFTHDVMCDECQEGYVYDAYDLVWWFTVEQDVGIAARTEEQAIRKFKGKYGDKPILGIIRPTSINNQEVRKP